MKAKSVQGIVPVVDLFAGPGGLSEGFCSLNDKRQPPFRVVLSIEKEPIAHRTLQLRSFFRQFGSQVASTLRPTIRLRSPILSEIIAWIGFQMTRPGALHFGP